MTTGKEYKKFSMIWVCEDEEVVLGKIEAFDLEHASEIAQQLSDCGEEIIFTEEKAA